MQGQATRRCFAQFDWLNPTSRSSLLGHNDADPSLVLSSIDSVRAISDQWIQRQLLHT